ncbi:unknown [Corallococcus sp. CAG:1435]|nr:unknown [Corallococcus sp. CAG:1435]
MIKHISKYLPFNIDIDKLLAEIDFDIDTSKYIQRTIDKKNAVRNYRSENRSYFIAYKRNWEKNNPDKVRQYRKNFYLRNLEKVRNIYRVRSANYRELHKNDIDFLQRTNLAKKKYRETHREELRSKSKEYYQKNKERIALYSKKYRETHRDKVNAISRRYYLRHRQEISIGRKAKAKQKEGFECD